MPEIEIRPVKQDDLKVLSRLDHSYYTTRVWQMDQDKEEGGISIRLREAKLPRAVRVDFPYPPMDPNQDSKSYSPMIVSLIDGEVVGYIRLLTELKPGAVWVRHLAVEPHFRRKGIGSALILAGRDWAARQRYNQVFFEVQAKNHPMIKMMEKLGITLCGYNDRYYPDQSIALFYSHSLR